MGFGEVCEASTSEDKQQQLNVQMGVMTYGILEKLGLVIFASVLYETHSCSEIRILKLRQT